MNKVAEIAKKHIWLVIVLLMMIIATVLRVIACYWGTPLAFHIDEQFILFPALKLIEKKTYICTQYMRPDQVEIKLIALVLNISSHILWGSNPNAVFDIHSVAIYLISRFCISIFGIFMVPISFIFSGHLAESMKIRKRPIQIISALFMTFSPILIQHSGYITPDVPLTCIFLLFGLFFMYYIEKGRLRDLVICAILSGIGTMIKYPAGILCIMIAFMVIYRAIKNHSYSKIFWYGILSAGIYLLTITIIMPNLLTDFPSVVRYFTEETQVSYAFARDRGYPGNVLFYFATAIKDAGYLSVFPFAIGIITVFSKRKESCYVFCIAPVFALCMAVLPVTLVRWTLPIFPYYYIMTAIGLSYTVEYVKEKKMVLLLTGYAIMFLTILNSVLSGLAEGKYLSLKDCRIYAMADLDEMGINSYNTISQIYTTLSPWYGEELLDHFSVYSDGAACIREEDAGYKYFAYTDNYLATYKQYPEMFSSELQTYEAIERTYPLVYEIVPDGNYEQKAFALSNIPYSLEYLLSQNKHLTGVRMRIVDISSP